MHLMAAEDYKHEWVIPRTAWYIRLYLWLWHASPEDITICKLFWGYVFIWVAVLIWLLVVAAIPFMLLKDKLDDAAIERCEHGVRIECCHSCWSKRRIEQTDAAVRRKERWQRSLPMKVLNGIVFSASWVVMKTKTKAVRYTLFGVLGFILTVGLIIGVYELWINVSVTEFLQALLIIGLSFVFAALFLLTFFSVLYVLSPKDAGKGNFSGLGLGPWIIKRLFKPVGRGTKKGTLSFGQVMKIGYVSVKSNTCPRVVIQDKK